MNKCKPICYAMLEILNWKFLIELKPQQRWEYCFCRNGEYEVIRDNVTLKLSEEEFNKYFVKLD